MFGTLRPHACRLGRPERAVHARFTCGLCHGLGARYGTLSRALVSSDAVFVGLLADALQTEGAPSGHGRCPLWPIARRPATAAGSAAVRFASAIQLLLADQWLADRAVEGRLYARLARPLARRRVRAAERELALLGIDVTPLAGFELRQATIERAEDAGPAEAAEPTAAALGHVLEQMAALPGGDPAASSAPSRAALRRLGRAVGSAIYWADALDDLERDYLGGDFNPCVVRRPLGWTAGALPMISPERVGACSRLLESAMKEMADSLAALPLRRHQTLLANILCDRFPALARRLVARAERIASPPERSRLAAWLGMPWYRRIAARMVLLVALFGAWVGGIKGLWAKEAPRPSAGPSGVDAGVDAGADAGARPGGWVPNPFGPGAPGDPSAAPSAGASATPGPAEGAAPGAGPTPGPSPGATGDPGSADDEGAGEGKGAGKGGGWPKWSGPCECCSPDKCCDCQGWVDGCCNRCCKEPCGDCFGKCCDPCKGCKDCGGGGCCCK